MIFTLSYKEYSDYKYELDLAVERIAWFPDFSRYAIRNVKLKTTGDRNIDSKAANKIAGYNKTPEGYVWHHIEDGQHMILVPRDLHEVIGHTGGIAKYKK